MEKPDVVQLEKLNEKMDFVLNKLDLMLVELKGVHRNTGRIPVQPTQSAYRR